MVIAAAIVLGLIFGSFFNVCIYRIPRGESVVGRDRPSHCPACKSPIRWYDNVPVFGFLLLAGRCRACRAPIPWRYTTVEIVSAAAFTLVVVLVGLEWRLLAPLLLFCSGLIVATFIDLEHRIIPNVITRPGIAIGLAASLLSVETARFGAGGTAAAGAVFLDVSPRDAAIAAVLGYGLLFAVEKAYLLLKRASFQIPEAEAGMKLREFLSERCGLGEQEIEERIEDGLVRVNGKEVPGDRPLEAGERVVVDTLGMGRGDAKLLAMIGAFLGVKGVLFALLVGSIVGTLAGLAIIAVLRAGRKYKIPYGPYLSLGAVLYLAFGEAFFRWYLA